MATAFMKWLETTPRTYERGIQMLTLGRLARLHDLLASQYIKPGMRVLELGCGTGALSRKMARRGAVVTAIDVSSQMLAVARHELSESELGERVTIERMEAALIADRFQGRSFDLVVASLFFSELPAPEQRWILSTCLPLLADRGRLLIIDEVVPAGVLAKLAFWAIRIPVAFLTWLLTRAATRALRDPERMLGEAGFRAQRIASRLGGSLVLLEAVPSPQDAGASTAFEASIETLRHRVTLRTLLADLWALFLRIVPPYPKVRPSLYAIGRPHGDSPVLVTGNYDLTVRRLVRALDGKQDVWLLVADSRGINVWCAAGGGVFTADSVTAALRSSPLERVVKHRRLVLPQLCANGVDARRVRDDTGWDVAWGPVRAEDLPQYLQLGQKTDAMRLVRFPLKDRLEMVSVTLGFYGLLILVPVLIFWRHLFWPVAISLIGLSYFYASVMPWLPGKDGLLKSLPLALIALAGLAIFVLTVNALPPPRLFNWALGLVGLSVFTAAEMQGMSPLMRGEQANWGWELVIAACLGLAYWLVPLAAGWR